MKIYDNGKSNSFRLIGFGQLARMHKLLSAQGAIFYFEDIDRFKAFCIAAVTKYWINWARKSRNRSGLKGANPSMNRGGSSNPILPVRYLAKTLGISTSTASNYLHEAEKGGYLSITAQFQPTPFPGSQMENIKKFGGYNPNTIRKSWNQAVIQKPNRIDVDVYFRRKKNLQSICSKNRKEKIRNYKGASRQ